MSPDGVCVQVVFGGGSHSALGVALLRTGGIITGVLLFMGLTVVILPKSATIEALRCEQIMHLLAVVVSIQKGTSCS